jgi:hypothetical protein
MSRGSQTFKQTDVTKAVKAVEKAGVSVGRVEIANGKIIVIAGSPGANQADGGAPANEWDSVK